jgi:alpha-tubulin suppressor-like RCC1 family protein
VDAGSNHTCALSVDGAAYCWGARVYGELGNGQTTGFQSTPIATSGGLKFKQLNVGDGHTCALTEAGEAYCWGLGFSGQLGTGGTADVTTPRAVASATRFTNISAGLNSSCAVATDGLVHCWGDNTWGQLGDGTVGGFSADPAPVSGATQFLSVSVGAFVACGVTVARDAYCWGLGSFGRLGTGESFTGVVPAPTLVATGLKYESLEVGAQHTCGVTIDRAMYCWGLNTYGKLGGDIGPAGYEPSPVGGGHTFLKTGAGSNHSCGLTTSNEVYCWGQNFLGQLGVPGQTKPTFTPLRVIL